MGAPQGAGARRRRIDDLSKENGIPRQQLGPIGHTVEDCWREIARVIRECIRSERDSLEGIRLVQLIHTCARLIESVDLERLLQELEE